MIVVAYVHAGVDADAVDADADADDAYAVDAVHAVDAADVTAVAAVVADEVQLNCVIDRIAADGD